MENRESISMENKTLANAENKEEILAQISCINDSANKIDVFLESADNFLCLLRDDVYDLKQLIISRDLDKTIHGDDYESARIQKIRAGQSSENPDVA